MAADAHDDVVFAGRLRRKDVDYARRLATELGAQAPFGRVAHDLLDDLIANGLGDLNESAIVELFRRPTDGR
jgi:3-hydroxyisobutyrate dehydrogenase